MEWKTFDEKPSEKNMPKEIWVFDGKYVKSVFFNWDIFYTYAETNKKNYRWMEIIYPLPPIIEETLKPCPFCGSIDIEMDEGSEHFYIRCSICETEGPACHEKEKAKEAWNKRANDES